MLGTSQVTTPTVTMLIQYKYYFTTSSIQYIYTSYSITSINLPFSPLIPSYLPLNFLLISGMVNQWIYDESPTDAVRFEGPLVCDNICYILVYCTPKYCVSNTIA